MTAFDLLISFVLTWSVGLGAPAFVRYVIVRRPLLRYQALGWATGLFVAEVVLWTLLGSQSKTHAASILVAVFAYRILQSHNGPWDDAQRIRWWPILVAVGVAVWAAVSVEYAIESWPQEFAPRETYKQEISCRIDGKKLTDRVFTNPFRDTLLAQELLKGSIPDRRGNSLAAEEIFADTLCALHSQTQLPLGVVYTHFEELLEALKRSDFTAAAFLEDAVKREAAQEAVTQRESVALRLEEHEERVKAVISGAAMFALPLAGLAFAWSVVVWAHRRLPGLTRAHIAIGAALLGAFGCFWLAAPESQGYPVTDGQLRLLGWTLLAVAAALRALLIGHSVAWGIRMRPKQVWPSRVATLRIAAYVSFVGAFVCFWIAAAEDLGPPSTEEQWRLLGWTLLAAAAASTWRERSPSFSATAEATAGRVSSPTPLPKSAPPQEMGAFPRASHTTWRCPRCRRLNRPGTAVCACGQSYGLASHGGATDASIPLPGRTSGHALVTGGGDSTEGRKPRRERLKVVWMVLGVVGAVAFVAINLTIGRGEQMLVTLISTLVQVVGLAGLFWLVRLVKNSSQNRRDK